MESNRSGTVNIGNNTYPFYYEAGNLTIYSNGNNFEIDGYIDELPGIELMGEEIKKILFKLETPISKKIFRGGETIIGRFSVGIKYVIEDYKKKSIYTDLKISFS